MAAVSVAVVAVGCGSSGSAGRSTPATGTIGTQTSSSAARSGSGGPQITDGSFYSTAVNGTLHYSVALPPGYADSGKRYPVIYVLHGLPSTDQAYRGIGGYADSLAATGHRAIVVGAQGARPGDTDPEWHDWGPGRDWETATEAELVHVIDDRYRTIARRSGRGIIGVSAGGYGATLIAIHHPETYQVIESWSGYFHITNPAGKSEDLGSPAANAHASAHASVPLLKHRFGAYPQTFFAFYIGAQDSYPQFVTDNEQLDDELNAAGIPHVFALYNGSHTGSFWREYENDWLAAAAQHLDPPSQG